MTRIKIYKRLRAEHIFLNDSVKDKDSVFRFLADISARNGVAPNARLFYGSIKEREKTMSTGIVLAPISADSPGVVLTPAVADSVHIPVTLFQRLRAHA